MRAETEPKQGGYRAGKNKGDQRPIPLAFSGRLVYNKGEGKFIYSESFFLRPFAAMGQDQWVSRETAAPPGLERSNELLRYPVALPVRRSGFSLRGVYERIYDVRPDRTAVLRIFIFPPPAAALAEGAAPVSKLLRKKRRSPNLLFFCPGYPGPRRGGFSCRTFSSQIFSPGLFVRGVLVIAKSCRRRV